MKINEIFYSLQGEGKYTGLPMAFIRVTGCNLRCVWCDTKYAFKEGTELTILNIINRVKQYPTKHVCLTGGEPLIQDESYELITQLINNGFTIYLETNGSIFLGKLPKSKALKISMDIKCPSSGEEQKMNFTNFELLRAGDQIKFIIANGEDFDYAKNILKDNSINPECAIIFTPCSISSSANNQNTFTLRELAELVLKDGLHVYVLPQLHKIIWPNKSRGV